MRLRLVLVSMLSASLAVAACTGETDDFGIDEELVPVGPMGKEDGAGRPGLLVATNTSATQVWKATNKWEDRDAAGRTWDQRYSDWIASLEEVTGASGYHTVRISTPWGKTIDAPVLECAETSIFLRATFAAWHNLPFFMEAKTAGGKRVYFGHNGIRTADGKYQNTPDFAKAYKDHSTWTAAELAAKGWPRDEKLRARAASGGDDEQLAYPGSHFGAYLDEVHLNKRAGHFIIYLLNFFGSANLADAANTYNLVPEAIHPGDMLLHRWQRTGIGDTKVVYAVGQSAAGSMTARLMSGSMPRREPKLYDEVASKGYFTQADTGGEGETFDGEEYWRLGGGVKRWRVAKNVGGYWTNTWMAADEASWINDQDRERISARPEQFEALLGEVSPAEKRDALVQQIEDARSHLMRYPASCAARERRERAFSRLHELAPQLGTSPAALDHELRRLEDYVFAALSYGQSRTCCWNSTTAAMADIILDYAEEEQEAACVTPSVFRSEAPGAAGTAGAGAAGGYARWADYADRAGRAAEWRAWSEDEPCAQRDVVEDVALPLAAEPWCTLDGGGDDCSDAFEPNDTAAAAAQLPPSTASARVCAGDQDFFSVAVSAGGSLTVRIDFVHADGDLDLELLGPTGARVTISEGTTNTEVVTAGGLSAGVYTARVYGYAGAVGEYTISR